MKENHSPLSDKPYYLYLTREQFNQLIETIELMVVVDEDNEVTREAAKMRDTFMRFAKKQKNTKGDDCAAVILYEREACPLIKLMLYYISVFRKTEPHDYFSEIRKNMRRKKHDSSEASQ